MSIFVARDYGDSFGGYEQSGPLKIYGCAVRHGFDDDEPEVLLMEGDDTVPPGRFVRSDLDWFESEVGNVGIMTIIGDEWPQWNERDSRGLFVVEGYMFSEVIDSIDYGREYDGGFNVEDVRPPTSCELFWLWTCMTFRLALFGRPQVQKKDVAKMVLAGVGIGWILASGVALIFS